MKKVAAPLKLELAQFRSLAAFAQFASDLDKATRDQLIRGEKLSEVIKQPQYKPVPLEQQVAILYVASKGFLDDVPSPRVRDFEAQFMRHSRQPRPGHAQDRHFHGAGRRGGQGTGDGRQRVQAHLPRVTERRAKPA